jgi:hypothetical protein
MLCVPDPFHPETTMNPLQPPPWRSPSLLVHGAAAVAASFAAVAAVGTIHALATHYAVRTELAAAPAAQVHANASLPCRDAPPPALAARPS